ncbi:hypothetical protein PLICBS_006378 [Purpureocillium lilacinum]|uniref:uncharacterized protein n=1 Tax=Purpureocillium lilacinum TaxID=33203 RepID=UPI00207FA4AD|nr:hypothetical protein PLICBS_006378 [Purpureocillium lilacinum]
MPSVELSHEGLQAISRFWNSPISGASKALDRLRAVSGRAVTAIPFWQQLIPHLSAAYVSQTEEVQAVAQCYEALAVALAGFFVTNRLRGKDAAYWRRCLNGNNQGRSAFFMEVACTPRDSGDSVAVSFNSGAGFSYFVLSLPEGKPVGNKAQLIPAFQEQLFELLTASATPDLMSREVSLAASAAREESNPAELNNGVEAATESTTNVEVPSEPNATVEAPAETSANVEVPSELNAGVEAPAEPKMDSDGTSVTEPAVASPDGDVDEKFPNAETFAVGGQMLRRPPYHLIVRLGQYDVPEIQCSHPPSAEFIRDYLDKWYEEDLDQLEISTNTGANGTPMVLLDAMANTPHDRDYVSRISLAPVILQLIETCLGYELHNSGEKWWHFRRGQVFPDDPRDGGHAAM